MKISVVGLGKIGLPLSIQFSSLGNSVYGVDIDPEVVHKVNSGIETFPGEVDLREKLAEAVSSGRLKATDSFEEAISNSEVVVVVVPLMIDSFGSPDFSMMDLATASVGKHIRKGTLVIYETTVPVGTTRNRFAPALKSLSGLTPGEDFHLVFSPERVSSGRVFSDLRRYPKLVGGINATSMKAGRIFYEQTLTFDERLDLPRRNGVWEVTNLETAEFIKLAETTYRDVNIALANQFALFADNQKIDFSEVTQCANSQPFSHLHNPGIAVGGHCIPVYPHLYLVNDPAASLIREARLLNSSMPTQCVKLLSELHGDLDGQNVVVLGVAYRGGVKETALSGVFDVVRALVEHKANVFVQDPMYSAEEILALGFEPWTIKTRAHAIIVQADHESYRHMSSDDFPGVRTIFDGRGIIDSSKWYGVTLKTLGRSRQ